MDREEQGSKWPLDEIKVRDYLKGNKGGSLEAIDIVSNKLLMLVLNSQDEICYKEGNNIKLLQKGREVFLLSEIPIGKSVKTETTLSQSAWTDSQYRHIARGINGLIENVTGNIVPDLIVDGPEEEEPGYPLVDGTTTFTLITPKSFWPEKLAEEYFNAAVASLNTLYESLVAEEKVPRKVTTEGLVYGIPAVRKRFQRLLENAGLQFTYLDRRKGYTYRKIRIWQVLIEEESDDIQF